MKKSLMGTEEMHLQKYTNEGDAKLLIIIYFLGIYGH